MRWAPTSGEALLWRFLRGKRLLGVQFRRQVPLGGYILDFYASSVRVAVEVDGGYHADHARQDAARDRRLLSLGVRVVRVPEQLLRSDPIAALLLVAVAIRAH
jgi:very-short-patch-repair endonuclease